MEIGKGKLTDMYAKMMVTRKFEETAAKLFTKGKLHGTAHFCIGEEATGIGVCAAQQALDQQLLLHALEGAGNLGANGIVACAGRSPTRWSAAGRCLPRRSSPGRT